MNHHMGFAPPVNDGGSFATYSMLAPDATWKLYYSKTAGSVSHTNTATAGGSSAYGNTAFVTDSATYRIKSTVFPLPRFTDPPTDPDNYGTYEDLSGNGRLDFADAVLYFNQMGWIATNQPVCAFDFNGNGRIDFADIVKLFGEI